MTQRDLRHSCFRGPEFRPQGPTGDWIQLGVYGAVVVWEEDGLERVAQWSSAGGLHIYTEGLHRSCIRLVCSWAKAKAVVANIRRSSMEAVMKRNEEIVSKLVEAAGHHVAVVVVGDYGSGKVWLSDMALRKMGLQAVTFQTAAFDEFDLRMFDGIQDGTGLILDEVHRADLQLLPDIAKATTKFVREKGGVVFITIPSGQENILSLFATATGETLGLRQTVEVTR